MKKILLISICLIGFISFLIALYLVSCQATLFASCLSIVMASIPTMIYLYSIVLLDGFEPEPWIVIACLFLWGIGVTSVSSLFLSEIIGNAVVPLFDAVPGIVIPVFVAPVIEELMKFIGIILILTLRKDRLTDFTDVVIYASLVGLGFAMIENIFYYAKMAVVPFVGDLVGLFGIRGILSAFVHPFFTIISTSGILLSYKIKKNIWKIALIVLGLFLAIIFHGVWNAALILGILGGIPFIYFGIYVPSIVIIGLIIYCKIKNQISVLEPHITSADDIEQICSWTKRVKTLFYTWKKYGFLTMIKKNRYYRMVTRLAICRHQNQDVVKVRRIESAVNSLHEELACLI